MASRIRRGLSITREVLGATVRAGEQHELALRAGAMSYSLLLSLAPLTVAVSMLASRLDVAASMPLSTTPAAELTVESLFGDLAWAGSSASVVALVLLVWGASSLFSQLTRALGRIWHQPGSPQGMRAFMRQHLFAFMLLFVAAFALFASSIIGNVIGGFASVVVELGEALGLELDWLAALARSRLLIDFGFASVLFLVAFTTVPRVRPRWRDVLPGALVTAGAYALGQAGLGIYLASSARFSIPGVFGALLGFLVWVYYTATIVLWGAELTYQIARHRACKRGGTDTAPYVCS